MAKVPESITVGSDGFQLPVEEILTGRGFITGKSGAGKSNTASVVAEELLAAGVSMFIVDTDGEYYGLKEQFDVLHAGADSECDVEVNADDAQMLAETALEEDVPVILDVSGFLDGERVEDLILRVVQALFTLEKQVRKPFPLLVEEVHEFIPETGGLDDLGEMLVRVAKRGRKRGLGLIGMSQRPAAVDKDFITQCDWIVWHRLTWDNDTSVVGGILGSDAADAVQDLDTGEALVMTDWDEAVTRVQFRRKRTMDAGATPGLAALEGGQQQPQVPEQPSGDPPAETTAGQPADEDDTAPEPAEPPDEDVATPEPADAREDAGDDSEVIVERVDGEKEAVVEQLAAKQEARDVPVAGKHPPADAHPNETPQVRTLWEFGHMMSHVFSVTAQSVVRGGRAASRSARSAASAAADRAAETAAASGEAGGGPPADGTAGGGSSTGDTDAGADSPPAGPEPSSAATGPSAAGDSGSEPVAGSEPATDADAESAGTADAESDAALPGSGVDGDPLAPGGGTGGDATPANADDALDLTPAEELFVKAGLVAIGVLVLVLLVLLFG